MGDIKNTEKMPIGYLNDAELDAKKSEHKVSSLHEVITENEEGEKHATYFKKPKLDHLQLLADYAKKGEEIKGLEVLFNTCRVCGSDVVLTDEEMKVVAYTELSKIFKRREAVTKKR